MCDYEMFQRVYQSRKSSLAVLFERSAALSDYLNGAQHFLTPRVRSHCTKRPGASPSAIAGASNRALVSNCGPDPHCWCPIGKAWQEWLAHLRQSCGRAPKCHSSDARERFRPRCLALSPPHCRFRRAITLKNDCTTSSRPTPAALSKSTGAPPAREILRRLRAPVRQAHAFMSDRPPAAAARSSAAPRSIGSRTNACWTPATFG